MTEKVIDATWERVKEGPSRRRRAGRAVGRAKRGAGVFFVALVSYFILFAADQYLGIYAWLMGTIALLDRLSSGHLVSKDLYMNLGLVALGLIVILKIGVFGGKDRPHGRRGGSKARYDRHKKNR